MAEPFRDVVDAVTGVEQSRRDQIPDLVRADRPDRRGFGQLVEPVGEIVRSDRLAGLTARPA